MPSLKQIMDHLEGLAPLHLAEKWDNVGLMIGSKHQDISKVLCALDLNEEVLEEAIKGGYQCIVTHHPFLFAPLNNLDLDSPKGKMIEQLIVYRIAVYSMHTNYDIAPGGVNDFLCAIIGLEQVDILSVTERKQLCKVAVYVPETHLEVVRDTVIAHNSCYMGQYKGCTFTSSGEGTFLPLEGSHPFIGEEDKLSKVEEEKLEFIACEKDLSALCKEIEKVHPYEEVALDVYTLNNLSECVGIGRVGRLEEPMSIEALITHLKKVFCIPYVRVTEMTTRPIQKVAICSGSGADYLKEASRQADVYITGDLKFHEGQKAKELGIPVIDIGHYASENIAMNHIATYLKQQFEELEVTCSKINGETLMIK